MAELKSKRRAVLPQPYLIVFISKFPKKFLNLTLTWEFSIVAELLSHNQYVIQFYLPLKQYRGVRIENSRAASKLPREVHYYVVVLVHDINHPISYFCTNLDRGEGQKSLSRKIPIFFSKSAF